MLKLSVTILVSIISFASANWPCPDATQIAPCVCSQDVELQLNMDCSAVRSDAELKTAFSADFPFTNYNELTIFHENCDNCTLKTLTLSTFGPVSFNQVTINGSTLHTVQGGTFGNSRYTLTDLNLNHNEISSFPFEEIGEFTSLLHLSLCCNQFKERIPPITSNSLFMLTLSSNGYNLEIDASLVRACPNIRSVYLGSGRLTEVPEFSVSPVGMFTGLEHIAMVDFRHNEISTLTEETIVGQNGTLSKVSFPYNKISTVYAGFISGFGPNGYLDMSHNQIRYLDEPVYRPVFGELSNSKSAQFTGNPINCGCELEWIVRTPAILDVLTDDTMCADGVTSVKSLPIEWFNENC